jgi:hypothetical protein
LEENNKVGSSSMMAISNNMLRFSDLEKYEDVNMENDEDSR